VSYRRSSWARLPRDTSVEQERHLAETLATEEALAAIPRLAADLGTDPAVVDRMCRDYEQHLRILRASDAGGGRRGGPAARPALHSAAPGRARPQRATVVRLRDERRIDDTVLRQVQNRLDIEEVRLSRRELAD
jgi:CPA1 family monovalent cation:H+ antiporter